MVENGVVKMQYDQPPAVAHGATSPPSIDEQKEAVRKAFDEANFMQPEDVWYAVSLKWWEKWKQYVGYESTSDWVKVEKGEESATSSFMEKEEWHPGKMDNASLQGDEALELSKSMVLGIDFILCPEAAYDLLKEWYGGGPDFKRRVVEHGESQKECRVEIHPYFLYVSTAASTLHVNTEREESLGPLMLDSTMLVEDAIKQVLKFANVSLDHARIHLVDQGEEPVESKISPAAIGGLPSAAAGGGNSKGPKMTRVDDKPYGDQKLQDLFHGNTRIRVLIETRRWREDLKVGTRLDARDDDNSWYDSVVTEVLETETKEERQIAKKVKVHFRCWDPKWDLVIGSDSDLLEPLFTRTPDWRHFTVGMRVEVKKADGGFKDDQKWYTARVVEVLEDSKQVKVSVENPSDTGDMLFGFEDEKLCRLGVHIKENPAAAAAGGSKRSLSSNAIVPLRPNTGTFAGSGHVLGNGVVKNPSTYSTYSGVGYGYGRANARGSPSVNGAVGLSNLGNTCFMNSMLQCLSNTEVLTEYFLAGRHEADINKDNPLGMKGVLADVYARLLKDMWSADYVTVAPTEFKRTISNFAPQFAGYQQHDSQELMSFLLDGLHEDLNRVHQKPYVKTKDYDGEPDAQLASESWQRHLLRNDSIVVDHCQGQLKSHVTCPKCGYESVTFDPYLSLSLPLPFSNTVKVFFRFFPLPLGSTPIKVKASILTTASGRDLKEWIVKNLCLKTSSLGAAGGGGGDDEEDSMAVDPRPHQAISIADVYEKRVFTLLSASQPISEFAKPSIDLYAYELEHPPVPHEAMVVTILWAKPRTTIYPFRKDFERFGMPDRISISSKSTYHDVHARVWAACQRFMREDNMDYENCPYRLHLTTSTMSTIEDELLDTHDFVDFKVFKNQTLVAIFDGATYLDYVDKHLTEQVDQSHHSILRRDSDVGARKAIPIRQCFEKFAEKEQLSAEDLWYCSKCKERLQAFKKLDVWSLPDVLILHLKRFSYIQGYSIQREKIEDLVTFPLTDFDLSDLIKGPVDQQAPPIYDLYAVSEHTGGLGGGHYTACAKNFKNDAWYGFNDSSVSTIHQDDVESTVVSSRAYVLFYKRRTGSLRWAGAPPPRPLPPLLPPPADSSPLKTED